MQKFASEYMWNADIRPVPGHSFIHLVSVASGEYYGPNNNADWFNKTAGEFTCSNGKTLQLDGGLDKYHDTFLKYGAVYYEHNNSRKNGPKHGEIHMASMNPAMHRGELIIKVANDKWADDLEKMANGDPVLFSMGTGVPYDTCSICGNQARTRNEYCGDLRYNKLGMDKNGHQAYAINDKPHFHDISKVKTPAEIIAFGLRKIASGGVIADDEEDLTGLWLPIDLLRKIATRTEADRATLLEKMSAIEKRILAEGMTPDEENVAEAFGLDDDQEDKIVQKMDGIPLGDMFHGLNQGEMLLPPKAFVRIVMHKDPEEIDGLDELPDAVKTVFSELKDGGELDEILSDGSYCSGAHHPSRDTLGKVANLSEELSLGPEPVRRRVITFALRGGKGLRNKTASAGRPSEAARYLAKEYAKYQLSFLAGVDDDRYTHLAAIQNQAL
jgi:hypothetical protein